MKRIDVLYACTLDFLSYAAVSAISVKENLDPEYELFLHFLYVNPLNPKAATLCNYIPLTQKTMQQRGIVCKFYNVNDMTYMFEGQNIGMWGKEESMTHYIYFLAPLVIQDVDIITYIDTDIIINADLSDIIEKFKQSSCLVGMASPTGHEDMGANVSNSGLTILNLEKWRQQNILESILDFGKKLPKTDFCDQYLLHCYFKINNSEKLYLFDKKWNLFPQRNLEIDLNVFYGIHYTGGCIKPWDDYDNKERASSIWWNYAKKTFFYDLFLRNSKEKITVSYEGRISFLESELDLINRKYLFINKFINLKSDVKPLLSFFKKNKIKNIILYGVGVYGKFLIDFLEGTPFSVCFAYDNKVSNYKCIKIKKCNYSNVKGISENYVIIVTVINNSDEITMQLSLNNDCRVYSLKDLLSYI